MATRRELDLSHSGPSSLPLWLKGSTADYVQLGWRVNISSIINCLNQHLLHGWGPRSMAGTASGVQFLGEQGFQLTQGTKYSDVHLNRGIAGDTVGHPHTCKYVTFSTTLPHNTLSAIRLTRTENRDRTETPLSGDHSRGRLIAPEQIHASPESPRGGRSGRHRRRRPSPGSHGRGPAGQCTFQHGPQA